VNVVKFQFLPAETKFYDWFEKASANLLDAAQQLQDLFDHYDDVENRVARITELEHKGDFIVHEVIHLLINTLIVPLDSEDIERLISSLDDALDKIEATAVRMVIFQIEAPTERAKQLARIIRSGANELHLAIPHLREKKNFRQVNAHIIEINTLENNGDRVLRDALVEIVNHKDDLFNLIRWKEIYEMLEETTDRIEDVADVLQRVIIKNG
jgi:predicted phosphate transport protein (TIGR00153 family)